LCIRLAHPTCTISNALPHSYIYTLSLHDALPICYFLHPSRFCRFRIERSDVHTRGRFSCAEKLSTGNRRQFGGTVLHRTGRSRRSEEHTSELQSPDHLVCLLLLEKKKPVKYTHPS